MSKEHLELLVAACAVVVVAAIIGLMAYNLLKPSRVPERITEFKMEPGPRADAADQGNIYAHLLGLDQVAPGRWEAGASHSAFRWPQRPSYEAPGVVPADMPEPVRLAVRHMLEGGPDYRG